MRRPGRDYLCGRRGSQIVLALLRLCLPIPPAPKARPLAERDPASHPKPCGVQVAPCVRRRWQDVTYAIAADPTIECGRRSMSPTSPAGIYVIGRVVGALLPCERRHPCLRAFPQRPQSSALSPLAGRTNALTLCPLWLALDFGASYPVAPLFARHFQRFPLRRAPSLSLSPGFVLPVVALAPPRSPRTRAVSVIFRRSDVAVGLAMREALPPAG